jgi:hypothetical protein
MKDRIVVLSFVIIIAAGCGGTEEQDAVPSPEGSREAAEVSTTGKVSESRSSTCPPLGDLTQTWDATGTPLVFDFRYPAGFEVREDRMVSESMYQLDMHKSVEFDGQSRQVVLSIIQLTEPVDNAIPAEVTTAQEQADNPLFQALAEMLPKPAGEFSYGGRTVPLFRTETDEKVIYRFNLPGEGGYYRLNVHFVPTHQAVACADRLKELGAAWVQRLTPSGG